MFIPGRIEVLGKHTDYCGGRSIVCAIDRGFHVEIEEHAEPVVFLENRDVSEIVSIDLNDPVSLPGHWGNYAVEVVRRLSSNFPERLKGGVKIRFHSDLPKAAGLSSQPPDSCGKRLLLVFFLRIALLADLAVFGGLDAAGVLAGLAGGFRLLAAGFRLHGDRAEDSKGANNRNE